MLLDQASDAQIRAVQVVGGLTMAAFIGARIFGPRARRVQVVVAGVYIAAVVAFVVYAVF
jgi:hypothetical protein